MDYFTTFFKNNSRKIFLILVLTFGFFYLFNFVFSYNDISTASGGVQEDFILEYNAGKNFAIKGFSNLFFLPDYSTDFKKDSPPIFYTHNPSLPSVTQGLLIKIGFDVFKSRIFYALISLIGIAFLFLFLSEVVSLPAAVFSSVFLIVNFGGFLSLADHNQYSFSFPILFGYLWARYGNMPKKYLIVLFLFFIASFANYMLAGFMLIAEALFGISEKNMRMFSFAILSVSAGAIIHIIQNMVALTPGIALYDIWLTAQNRFFGTPSRKELLSFYQAHNMVLWGVDKHATAISYLSGAVRPFYLFKVPLAIGGIFTFFFYIFKRGSVYKNRKFIIPLFLSVFIWQTLFLPTIGNHPLFFYAFLAIFLGMTVCDLFCVLIEKIMPDKDFFSIFLKNVFLKIIILFAIGIICWKYFALAGDFSDDKRLSDIFVMLESYKDKTFFTNITPNTVSFKTSAWSIGFCLPKGLIDIDALSCYSKFSGISAVELVPDYILLSSRAFAFKCNRECFSDLKDKLSAKYELIEEINDGEDAIYKVKK